MSTIAQRSLSAGEISPSLYSRVDTTRYQTGLKTCRNHLVMRHGGSVSRAGTSYVGEVRYSATGSPAPFVADRVRLIPFVFNSDQTYVLEFGNYYMSIIKDGAYLFADPSNEGLISGISNALQATVTRNSHGLSVGDVIYMSGVLGMTEVNGRYFIVSDITTNTYMIRYMNGDYVDSTNFGIYTSGGGGQEIFTLTTTYETAELENLKYVQSADVLTLTCQSQAPKELARVSETNWTLTSITFAPSIAAPGSVTNSGAAGTTDQWKVTAVKSETFEESVASSSTGANALATSGSPITISWAAVTGAGEYNVYKYKNGVYGFIGTAVGTSFIDNGIVADTTDTPPETRNPFATDFPATVSYYQQRLMFGNTLLYPEKVWGSQTGNFHNFTTSVPTQDDDSITFSLAGRQVNAVKHLVDLTKLLIFTTAGEWIINGDDAGVLRPGFVNPTQHSYNGASDLQPVVVSGSAVYVQGRGSAVRDIAFDYQVDGYRGNDLTIFSAHLFDGYTLIDLAYQQIPHSVVWAVRSDGALLGMTYVKEQQILGWHRHDFEGGEVENICVIPEGDEDVLYLSIKRTINGIETRYIERMNTRQLGDIKDFIGMDAAASYDGRLYSPIAEAAVEATMELTGGVDWTHSETLRLVCSQSFFSSAEVGNEIQLIGSDGTLLRFEILSYISATAVDGKCHKDVPQSMQYALITDWTRAVDQLSQLWHLEGEEVSVFADGFVIASPNNSAYNTIIVTNGAITLDRPYGVIHVGLPITADLETLNVDTAQGETIANRSKLVTRVSCFVEKTRGFFAGASAPTGDDLLDGLFEAKIRNQESYDEPDDLQTGTIDVNIRPEWKSTGSVFIRQVDPVPTSILGVMPIGLFPFKGQGGG